jgi:hypothetical protein
MLCLYTVQILSAFLGANLYRGGNTEKKSYIANGCLRGFDNESLVKGEETKLYN